MNKRLRTIVQYIFFFSLGIFLVWWSLRDLNREQRSEIHGAIKHARYYLIIPVFLVLISGHYFRALRWRLLIGSLGYMPGKANTFCAVMIGYLANAAFPRLGEVLKCTVLARYEKVPADKLVGTIILERVIDVLCLLVVFAITLALDPSLYGSLADKIFAVPVEDKGKKISGTVIVLLLFALVLLATGIWMIVKKKKIADLLAIFKLIVRRIWEGVSAIQHLKTRKMFILYTLLIWASYFAGGYLGFLGLQETQNYGVTQAFAVLSAGSVGMTITPGGIGGYAFLIEQTMMVYGLQQGIALAFGWILWLANTTVILVGGLISFVALPSLNKKKLGESVL
jgi:uncharacterized protein (TIRG00374 family)